jgi:PIN domain nuclease of toxin-antitoxin system
LGRPAERLTNAAREALDNGRANGTLACAGISFWEIAMLFRKKRLILPAQHTAASYIEDIAASLDLNLLPLTPAIAALAESEIIAHGDPGDRLIAATALIHQAPLVTADEKLRATPGLSCIW